ncbi:MAG: ParB N-terminal domain-containing protein [Myxococcales bacterium]|nr:ParB N-terminal domain-containing protein [Myxococcales bacterium]
MDLELHQLDRRYEALRTTSRERDSRVVASLARDGQQLPVVVIAATDAGRYILVDGYKRVRGLHKLGQDLVRATCWDLPEPEALLLGRLMRAAEGRARSSRHGWCASSRSDSSCRSKIWPAASVAARAGWSRRLGLAATLPEAIQQLVRDGKLSPHAAMKHLLPLARANRAGAIALAQALAPLRPSTRQTALLCAAFARGSETSREQLLLHPELLLRASEPRGGKPDDPAQELERDVGAVGGIARRALTRVRGGSFSSCCRRSRRALRRTAAGARRDVEHLVSTIEKEVPDVG